MVEFIQSPLFDEWFEGKRLSRHLVICSPYIKEGAIRAIFDYFRIDTQTSLPIEIYTTGRPEVYVSGSSDISAIEFLTQFKTVKIYLLDNIHMKAYCIDDDVLLVGSGNCTAPGLFAQGNVEAAISTTDKDVIDQFNAYCKAVSSQSKVLKTSEDIESYCEDLAEFYGIVHEEIQLETETHKTICRLGRERYVTHRYIIGGTHRIKQKIDPIPWSADSSLADRRQVSIIKNALTLSNPSPEEAYFLGGIIAGGAREWSYKDGQYYDFTVKQNNNPGDAGFIKRLSEHASFVSEAAMGIQSEIVFRSANEMGLKDIFRVHVGFALLFKIDYGDNEINLETILNVIQNSDDHIIRAFLVGVFDTRGYIDNNYGYIGLDVPNDDVATILASMIQRCGIETSNHNPSRERENNQGTPRKPQLRVKLKDFFENIGLISPDKICSAKEYPELSGIEFFGDSLLPGLKRI